MTIFGKLCDIWRIFPYIDKAKKSATPVLVLINCKVFFGLMPLLIVLLGVAFLPAVAQENSGSQKTTPLAATEAVARKDAVTTGNNAQSLETLEWFKATIPLVQTLIWPAAVLIIILIFQSQISNLIFRRLRSGKFKALGVEVEIEYVKDTKHFEEIVHQRKGGNPKVYGNPDSFQLLAKATTSNLMKSTKVMNTPNGCVVQVSTKEIGPTGSLSVAEAVTFIPDINVTVRKDGDSNLIDYVFWRV